MSLSIKILFSSMTALEKAKIWRKGEMGVNRNEVKENGLTWKWGKMIAIYSIWSWTLSMSHQENVVFNYFTCLCECPSEAFLQHVVHARMHLQMLSWKSRMAGVIRKPDGFRKTSDVVTQHTEEYTAHCRLRQPMLVTSLSLKHTSVKKSKQWQNLDLRWKLN